MKACFSNYDICFLKLQDPKYRLVYINTHTQVSTKKKKKKQKKVNPTSVVETDVIYLLQGKNYVILNMNLCLPNTSSSS